MPCLRMVSECASKVSADGSWPSRRSVMIFAGTSFLVSLPSASIAAIAPTGEDASYSRDTSCILTDRRVFQRAGKRIEVQQEMAKATSKSTGTSVWEASVVLSEYMQNGLPKGYWNGKRVLELGAGTGFTSIVAAALGAQKVVVSDGNARVLQLASQNAAANLTPSQLQAMAFSQLQWEAAADPNWKYEEGEQFDVILAADVTYSPDFIPLLMQVIRRLSSKTADIFIAHTTRSKTNGADKSLDQFNTLFEVERIEVLSRGIADCSDGHKPTSIYRMRNLPSKKE
jgi:predicted nicotinamide N-methyase